MGPVTDVPAVVEAVLEDLAVGPTGRRTTTTIGKKTILKKTENRCLWNQAPECSNYTPTDMGFCAIRQTTSNVKEPTRSSPER